MIRAIRWPKTALFILLAASHLHATDQRDGGLLDGNPLRGRELFVSKGCIECHSVRGVGGTVGPDLGLKIFSKSVYEIAGVLWNHSPFMSRKMQQMGVQRPKFQPSEMLDLVSFLYFMNYFDPPGDVRAGRQLFAEKKCSVCHSVGSAEQKIAAPLDRLQNSPTSVFLAQSMWNHGEAMLEMLRRMDVQPPTFRGTEMVDLAAYIRQLNRNPRRELFSLGEPRQGERLFDRKGCASCHAPENAPRTQAPDLRGPRFQASVSQIAGLMWNHLPAMRVRMSQRGIRLPSFSGEEMNHLISYLYSLAYIGKPGDPQKGAKVFTEKRCISCHGHPGRNEERLGPDLAAVSLDGPLGTIPAMWNHALEMEGRMKQNQIVWPRFEGSEMADLQAYLRTTRRK